KFRARRPESAYADGRGLELERNLLVLDLSPQEFVMAPLPAWKGYLKLSLVTCAVELTNVVTHTEKVSFRVLNRKTGNTVKRIYVDAETGKPLEEGDEIKGYQVNDGEFVHI